MIRGSYKLTEGGFLVRTQLAATHPEPYELFLDATAIRRVHNKQAKEDRAQNILKLLDKSGVAYGGNNGLGDSRFSVQVGFTRHGYGVFGMLAEVQWPKVSDARASALATQAMRAMARNIGIYPEKDIDGMVYASVNRAYGVTLETNPAGSSSMDTNGMEYNPQERKMQLYSHNLYTPEMQLVCMAGIMALAGVETV